MSDISDDISTDQYFATLPPIKLISCLKDRVKRYDDYVYMTGRLELWSRAYNYYNAANTTGGTLNRSGEQGEYTELTANHFRNILIHILNLITGERPTFEARATNTDFDSMAQTQVANGILDYYNRFKNMAEFTSKAVEIANQFGEGYVYAGWDYSLGDPYMVNPQTQQVEKQGDIFFKNFTPMDVVFDYTGCMRGAPRQWHVIRDFQNKWDLIERYPEMKDKILRYATDSNRWQYLRVGYYWNVPTDYVPVFVFLHEKTNACPNGRYFTYLDSDCWFIDAAMPDSYDKSPLHRMCPSEQINSGFGYTPAYDILPLQEAIDGLYSTILTNQTTFGVQNILVPSGANITTSTLTDGLNIIEYEAKLGEPKPLVLLGTPPEIFEFLEKLEQVMQTISGVNSVVRGDPDSSLKSGSALALVQSQAIQFISDLQKSYVSLLEELGTSVIKILQENATTPRMIEVSGKTNKSYLKAFTNQNISSIHRVTVDLGNPVSRTTAGKVSIADNLLKAGMIEDPSQYLQVLTTGKLEPLIEGKISELMLVRSENEGMSDGKGASVIAIDNHVLHIMEHKSLLSNLDSRTNPQIVQLVLSHIDQHIQIWQQISMSNPALLQAMGQPLAPPPMMLPPPPIPGEMPNPNAPPSQPVPQAPPQQSGPDMPAPNQGQIKHLGQNVPTMAPGNPGEKISDSVHMPNMPKNPATNQRAPAAAGGR